MKKERNVYQGIIVDVYRKPFDDLDAEIIRHPGGVAVAAQKENGDFFIVKQFRYAVEENLYEFPAGKIDPNEEPQTTALRELREETGYEAHKIEYLGKVYPSPAYLDEVLYLYYACDLNFVGQDLDENEELSVHSMPLEEIEEKILNGEIVDAKTIALIYHLKNKHKKTT